MTHRRSVASINAVLQAQLKALEQLEQILGTERDALTNRQPEDLLEAADAKAQALANLDELEQQRKSISADIDGTKFDALRELTQRCQTLNLENAALLNAQQQHVNRLLGLLRGSGDNKPSAYDASGNAKRNAAHQLRLTEA